MLHNTERLNLNIEMEWWKMKHKFEALEMVNKNSDKAREKARNKMINRIKRMIKGVK